MNTKFIPAFSNIQHRIIATATPHITQFKMVTASINDDMTISMSDAEYRAAIRTGFFQLKIPAYMRPHIETLKQFAREFYKDKIGDGSRLDQYRGFNEAFNRAHPEVTAVPFRGYMVDNRKPIERADSTPEKNQVRRLGLGKSRDSDQWTLLPPEVEAAERELNKVGVAFVNFILDKLGVIGEDRGRLTGLVSVDQGDHGLLFNHFDGARKLPGLRPHRDYGWVTALISPIWAGDQVPVHSGLEAKIGEPGGEKRWMEVVPDQDVLIFNFGASAEKSTQHLPEDERIHACIHQVRGQENSERSSHPLFFDPNFDSPMYTLHRTADGGYTLEKIHNVYSEHALMENSLLYD